MAFATPAEVDAGLEAYNRYLADLWRSKQGELRARLEIAGQDLVRREARVREVERIDLELESPPRLFFESDSGLGGPGRMKVVFAFPGAGSWSFGIRARVRVLPWSRRGDILKVRVKQLRVRAELEIDRRSSTEADLIDTRVDVSLKEVDVDASNFLVRIVARLLSLLLDALEGLVEDQVRDALEDSLPDAGAVRAVQDLNLASEPVELPGPAPSLPALEDDARQVARRIREQHLPYGTVFNTLVPQSPPHEPVKGYRQFEDSAIWTGHYIAGEVYRYEVTRETEALENVREALEGVDRLTRLTDDPGLLSRLAVPLTDGDVVEAIREERIAAGHVERLFVSADGTYQSIGHITRDQYMGAFLGTGLAALRLEDGELRQKAQEIALRMADYLVERLFCPTEAVADAATGTQLTSVTYLLNPTQILAILQLARRLDRTRYGGLFDRLAPISSIQWLFQWLQSVDPHDSYFKFNLAHAAALLLLALEDDAGRRAELAVGFRTVRRAIRYHANPYFNLVELETLGGDEDLLSRPRAEIENETRHLLAQAYRRPPLIETVDLSGEADLEIVEIRRTSRAALNEDPEKVSRRPVDVVRRPGADFLWQRSPFRLKVVWDDLPTDPAMRSPNVDLTLPYWMARKLGL